MLLAYGISILCGISACKLPGKETIDKAIELGKQSPFRDTSIYLRVFENSQHDLYLNGRLVSLKQLEVRVSNLKKLDHDALILYANDTPATRIPKDSKILPVLSATQTPVVLYRDSSFKEQ